MNLYIRVYGIDLALVHARELIGQLKKDGSLAALAAAKPISAATDQGGSAGPLTPEMRNAILAAIQRFPTRNGIERLHRALLKDLDARALEPE